MANKDHLDSVGVSYVTKDGELFFGRMHIAADAPRWGRWWFEESNNTLCIRTRSAGATTSIWMRCAHRGARVSGWSTWPRRGGSPRRTSLTFARRLPLLSRGGTGDDATLARRSCSSRRISVGLHGPHGSLHMMVPSKTRPWRRRLRRPDPKQETSTTEPVPVCAHCARPILFGKVLSAGPVLLHETCLKAWRERSSLPLFYL
jgi:hypothetical protein